MNILIINLNNKILLFSMLFIIINILFPIFFIKIEKNNEKKELTNFFSKQTTEHFREFNNHILPIEWFKIANIMLLNKKCGQLAFLTKKIIYFIAIDSVRENIYELILWTGNYFINKFYSKKINNNKSKKNFLNDFRIVKEEEAEYLKNKHFDFFLNSIWDAS